MWYTTYLELHSQATRLQEAVNQSCSYPDGSKTLFAKSRSKANFKQRTTLENYSYTQHFDKGTL